MFLHHLNRLVAAAAVLISGLWVADTACAQTGSMFSGGALQGSNGFRNGTTGASNFGSMGGSASSTFGSRNTGSSMGSQGAGALGMGGMSGMGAGGAGVGMQQGQIATQPGQRRSTFVGRDDSANRFLGSSTAGNQQMNQGRNGQRNRQGVNRAGRNAQQQNFMNQGNQFGGNSAAQQRQIRPQLKAAFTYTPPSVQATQVRLTTRFEKLAARAGVSNISIETDVDHNVILRGLVDTEDNRKLAAILVALEPGVRSVQNELTVTSPEPTEATE